MIKFENVTHRESLRDAVDNGNRFNKYKKVVQVGTFLSIPTLLSSLCSMASLDTASTLLDLFENTARSEADLDAVECGEERWTYGELDIISSGLALEMHKTYGRKPVVVIVSENHPYTLAMVLGTWKLGGIVAPLDHNIPRDIMERMLLDIKPTFVLVPSNQLHVQKVITGNIKRLFLDFFLKHLRFRHLMCMRSFRC